MQVTSAGFLRFATSSYCAGAVERRCLRPDCYWASGTWDPGAPVHHFSAAEASRCTQAQKVLFVGDSTARHTFYAYTAIAGHPLVPTMKWRDGAFEPQGHWPMARRRAPAGSNRSSSWAPQTGWDRHGACDVTHRCTRDEPIGIGGGRAGSGRAGYSATKVGAAEEMGRYRRLLSNGSWDAVVVQCPLWHFIEKGAYDATLTSVARRAAVRQRTALPADDGAAALSGFGAACARYVQLARRQRPAARVFLLGHFARAARFKKAGHAAPDTRARLPSWRLPAHGPCLTSVGPFCGRHSPRSRSGTARRASASSGSLWQSCMPPSASAVGGAAAPMSSSDQQRLQRSRSRRSTGSTSWATDRTMASTRRCPPSTGWCSCCSTICVLRTVANTRVYFQHGRSRARARCGLRYRTGCG